MNPSRLTTPWKKWWTPTWRFGTTVIQTTPRRDRAIFAVNYAKFAWRLSTSQARVACRWNKQRRNWETSTETTKRTFCLIWSFSCRSTKTENKRVTGVKGETWLNSPLARVRKLKTSCLQRSTLFIMHPLFLWRRAFPTAIRSWSRSSTTTDTNLCRSITSRLIDS